MNSRIYRLIPRQTGGYHRGKVSLGVMTSVLFACMVLISIAAPSSSAGRGPNHLVPIPAYNYCCYGYEDIVRKTLIKDRFPEAWMMVLPSFTPEYAVVLRKVEPEDSTGVYYELEYAAAEQQIYNLMDVRDGIMDLDPRKDVKVNRQVTRLPNDLAANLVDTWKAIILQTKYAEDWPGGLDGEIYEFYVYCSYFGETWSPDSGIPKMMVDCGHLLIDYVKGSDSDRPKIEDRLRRSIAEIEKALD
jgi:hypothetical protein